MKKLIVVFCLPFLAGCIFNKDENNSPAKNQGPVNGVILLADDRGFNKETQNSVLAGFLKSSGAVKSLREVVSGDLNVEREMKCATQTKPVQNFAKMHAVSVGKLEFTIGTSTLAPPFYPERGRYEAALKKTQVWPQGTHKFTASGSNEAHDFSVDLKMPALFEEVKVNGAYVLNGIINVPLNQDIEIGFKLQANPPSEEGLYFQMEGIQDGQKTVLVCGILEKDINSTWVIPASQLSQYPSGLAQQKLYIVRESVVETKDPKFGDIQMVGIRQVETTLTTSLD